MVDLEGDSDTKIASAVSGGHTRLLSTYLYSTPSLITIGFFFKLPSDAVSWRSNLIFFPGGRVGDASSKVKMVT